MARNIEIKAHLESIDILFAKVAALADGKPVEIEQDDTFFPCEKGRLKLREFADKSGELIFYQRADQPGPKESFYLRTPVAETAAMRDTLSRACGQLGRIRKRRTLYLIGRTRVHLDRVESLGDFLELEVVLAEGESAQAGIDVARQIMLQLGIQQKQLIDCAYIDLLWEKPAPLPNVRFNHCAAQFIVQDISRSVDFYKNRLGFDIDYLSGCSSDYAVVCRDDVYIHLCLPQTQNSGTGNSAVFIAINGIDELWYRVKNTESDLMDQLAEKDYGAGVHFKVFTLRDPDKNILRIGEKIVINK